MGGGGAIGETVLLLRLEPLEEATGASVGKSVVFALSLLVGMMGGDFDDEAGCEETCIGLHRVCLRFARSFHFHCL